MYSNGTAHTDIQILKTMTMCDAYQRFKSPPSSFKALVPMKATRAARKARVPMKATRAAREASRQCKALAAQPSAQPSLNNLLKAYMKLVKELEKLTHNSPRVFMHGTVVLDILMRAASKGDQ